MRAYSLNNLIQGQDLCTLLHLHGALHYTLSQADINITVIYNTICQQTIEGTLQVTYTAVAGLGDIRNHILRNLQAVLTNLDAHDIFAKLHIRLLQLGYQTAGETGNQTVWHILQLYRRTITSQNDTLTITEEMVEDMEEGIQSLCLSCPILHIIHNQNIDRLIEVDEVVARIMQHRIRILCLEQSGTDIQHALLRIQLLGSQADGVHQMGLSATRRTIYEHRVKLRGIRMLSDRQSHRTRQLVALALYIGSKGEFRIKLGVNIFLLHLGWRSRNILIHRMLRFLFHVR